MEELVSLRPRPHLSPNYIPVTDVLPETYEIIINNDLSFEGLNYNTFNDGFRGLIGLGELTRIVRDSLSRDPKRRRRARKTAATNRTPGVNLG